MQTIKQLTEVSDLNHEGQSHYFRRRPAADYLGVSLGTLDIYIKRRIVPCIRPSSRVVLIRRGDLDAALDRFKVEPRAKRPVKIGRKRGTGGGAA